MEFLNKAKGIITPNKKVYYPADNRSGGIADSNLMYNIPKSYSGGGGTEPLIIHLTEEEVKDPQTQKTIGFKTDTLASDAYEAWQNGRPIYYNIKGDEWAVSSVKEGNVVIIYWMDSKAVKDVLFTLPFADGYLIVMSEIV